MADHIKILFFSDSHLGFDYPVKPKLDIRRRGPDFFSNHELILADAVERKVDLVLHGGDFFFRTKIPKQIEAMAYDSLLRFAGNGIPIVIVPGNHESSRLPGSLLTQHPGINIFERPEVFNFEIRGRRISIAGFPYYRKNLKSDFSGIMRELNAKRKLTDISLLLMHHAVEGAKVGPGNFTFRHGDDVVQMRDIPESYDAVLSGHIHRAQILEKKFGNGNKVKVIYPGSIERTAFAEKDENKGYFLMVFNPGNKDDKLVSLDFVQLPARPMTDIRIMIDTDKREDLEIELRKLISGLDPDSIIRIECAHDRTKQIMTASFLREVLPNSTNYQLKGFSGFKL